MSAPAQKPLIRVLIRHRQAVFQCSPESYGQVKPLFAYLHPSAKFIPSVRTGEWDGMIHLMRWGKVSAGLFHAKRAEVEKLFRLDVVEEKRCPAFHPETDATLRPYQLRAEQAMIEASGLGGIILSATGSGKTKLAGSYFKRLIGTGVFIVDELTLLEQARRELSAATGESVGIVGRSLYQPQRITVATIQTLHRHRARPEFKEWFSKVDVIIIDEVHLALNRRNLDVVTRVAPKAVFGLTATLQLKKQHVEMQAIALCGPVIFEYTIKEGVEEGFLSKGRIFIVPFKDPLQGPSPGYWSEASGQRVFIPANSPTAKYRRHICLNKARNDLIEALVRRKLAEGRKIIVLVEQRLHLRKLDARFADVNHYTLSGNVETAVRLQAMREMDAGTLNLILASRVFAKGVDVQKVDCIIDATGVPSRNSVLQRYGRGVRKTAGKSELLFYDIADRNSSFTDAAWARYRALQETGAPVTTLEVKAFGVLF